MEREVVTLERRGIKIGLVNSRIASVRTSSERETAARVFDGQHLGVASALGEVSLDALTARARDALAFGIPYPVEPSGPQVLSASHEGPIYDVQGLVDFTEAILAPLREEFPGFVLSQGVEQKVDAITITNDRGLDLSFREVSTSAVFVVKEKGSPNIIDTFFAVESPELDAGAALDEARASLSAWQRDAGALPTGRQKIVFRGIGGESGGDLVRLFRTDCTARPYATGASIFSGKLGDTSRPFHPALRLYDSRDASRLRICPFDIEGTVREAPDLDIVRDGAVRNVAACKRDAARYGLPATGSAAGGLGGLPDSALIRLVVESTADELAELLGGEPGVLVWFAVGGDVTRAGDLAMPVPVALRVNADGSIAGRLPTCTLTGNLFEVFGADFVGASASPYDPWAQEGYVVTHMTVRSA